MSLLDTIKDPIQIQFEQFDRLLIEAVKSDHTFLKPITEHLLKPSGKRMRPLLCLLSAAMHGEINDKSYAAALLLEMIHWSTLVHDDVVDEAYQRRGEWTPAALLRSKSAVLVGDYLFSKGLAIASRAKNYQAIDSTTITIEQIVEGELLQMEHSRRMDTNLEIYLRIITLKTAVLIASAAQTGAASVGASPKQVERMYQYGLMLGMAFQIKDDILDFGQLSDNLSDRKIGKSLCNDLREKKITLPLIYSLEQSSASVKRECLQHLRQAANDPRSVEWLRSFVFSTGGISHAVDVTEQYLDKSRDLLASYPESVFKSALLNYGLFVAGRTL